MQALSIVVVLVASLLAPSVALGRRPSPRVTVVLAPYLTWDDVLEGRTPNIARLATNGGVANVNVQGAESAQQAMALSRGALSLSAGAFVMAEDAPSAFMIDERFRGERASAYYRRTTGWRADDQAIAYLGMPRQIRANTESDAAASLGALGEAISGVGGATIALGNSDGGFVGDEPVRQRPAGLVAMDANGRVQFGDLSSDLLRQDDDAPFGFRTDVAVLERAYDRALRDSSRHSPRLVVIDPGDTARAARFAELATDDVAERQRRTAIATIDAVVGMVGRDALDDGGSMMIVSTVMPGVGGSRSGFAPAIVVGGMAGRVFDRGHYLLSSPSTHREGLVTLPDLTAHIMWELGLESPRAATGNPLDPVEDRSGTRLEESLRRLQGEDVAAMAVDSARPSVMNAFILVTAVLLGLCTLLLVRSSSLSAANARKLVALASTLILMILSVPLASAITVVAASQLRNANDAMIFLVAATLGVGAVALLLKRVAGMRLALAAVCLATAILVLVDQSLGGPWTLYSFFSYSPLIGARYYGLGNEGASLLVGACLVGLALVFDRFADADWVAPAKRSALPVVAAMVVGVAAAPPLGANFGVLAWGTAAFAVAWLLMNGRSLSWRSLAVIGAGILLLVVGFSALDLGAATTAQTHLARALTAGEQGGFAEIWRIVSRKAALSASIFAESSLSYLLVAGLVFLAYVRWRPRGAFSDLLTENPHFAAAITAVLVGSGVSLVTEDSGIVMPALMTLYVAFALLYLMLSPVAERGGE